MLTLLKILEKMDGQKTDDRIQKMGDEILQRMDDEILQILQILQTDEYVP